MTASVPDNEAVFHAARDIPDPDCRREYVREACGGDDARIVYVEALLAAAARPDSLLDRPAAAPPAATIDEPATENSSNTVIGPYKLLEQIGEGGMGRVWMAQQTEPVKRLVAVKLIKAGMDSKQVIARFEAERQALALMDHPNIARVLDSGTTSAGRPYFVMDLVKGVPITRQCDEHHLTPRKRLELFIPVCQAVQHAHQKGIIHRDLKPSNVLVALYDGKPVPKVIDFGVANQALSIRKQLVDDFPSRPGLRRLLAGSYNNLGTWLLRNGPLPEAEKNLDLALSVQTQLVADFPSNPEFRKELAQTHNNRGNLEREKGRIPEAEQDYNQALSTRKQLVADFPSRPEFRMEVASSHYSRAFVLSATGRRKEAEKDYDQAVSIFKQLAADFPSRPEYHQGLARSHQNRAMLLSAAGRPMEAEKDYDQAASIFKQLATDFPSRLEFRQGLVASHLSRGFLMNKTGRFQEAEKDYDQALKVQKQSATDFPDQPDRLNDVAKTYVDLAFLHARRGTGPPPNGCSWKAGRTIWPP